jgi:hypothetical protein
MSSTHTYCLAPDVEPGDLGPTCSKYFGKPWFPKEDTWPISNGRSMEFIMQLNAADLPPQAARLVPAGALLQLFNDADGVKGERALVKVVYPGQSKNGGRALAYPERDPVTVNQDWKPVTITGWEAVQDCPYVSLPGDKLLGFPYPPSYTHPPQDRKGNPMRYLYQIYSGSGGVGYKFPSYAPKAFADDAAGHIYVSEDMAEFAFAYAQPDAMSNRHRHAHR